MILETLVVGPLDVNCYIIAGGEGRKALIIDPGGSEEKIIAALERRGLVPGLVVNTHGHYDHIGCDDCFGVDVCVHKDDAPLLEDPKRNFSVVLGDFYRVHSRIRPLEDLEELLLDGVRLQVIHTPGHSAGGICLLMSEPQSGIIFSGDTLFREGVGRTDLSGGDEQALQNSISGRLMTLPEATVVYPGHGPSSTIGHEKRNNPFLWKSS